MLGANIFYAAGIDSRFIVNFTECSVKVGFLRVPTYSADEYVYERILYFTNICG